MGRAGRSKTIHDAAARNGSGRRLYRYRSTNHDASKSTRSRRQNFGRASHLIVMLSGVETSLDIFNSKRSQRFLDFARNDGHEDTTSCLFSSLHIYHDNSPHSAAMNMAIDEALLEHATVASIRFYRWHSPALSFGYFGRFADVARYQCERDLVRRWTGGGIVFHGEDLTYSLAIPNSDTAFAELSISIYEKIHRALCDALSETGQRAVVAGVVGSGPDSATMATRTGISDAGCSCFANPVRADVMI